MDYVPERIVENIQQLQTRGIHQVSLSLDLTTFPPTWWQTFFRLICEQEIYIELYTSFFNYPPPNFSRPLPKPLI